MNTKQMESKNSGIKTGDWVIMQDTPRSLWIIELNFGIPYKVENIRIETDEFKVDHKHYLIQGTYYQPDEIKKVTPEDDPEYFI